MKVRKKRKYKHHKSYDTSLVKKLPNKYQEDWISSMDLRTKVFFNSNETYQRIIADLGGFDSVSRIELSLIERFVYTEQLIRGLEKKGCNGDEEKFLEKYMKLSNSINSIAAKLGCARRNPTGQSELSKILKESENKTLLQKMMDD